MFVDYTWQCMKLPDQPPSSSGAKTAGAVKGAETSDHSDVIIAAADSTTHGVCSSRQLK